MSEFSLSSAHVCVFFELEKKSMSYFYNIKKIKIYSIRLDIQDKPKLIFSWFLLKYSWWTILYGTDVQYSDSQLLTPFLLLYLFIYYFGCACDLQKLPGQRSNLTCNQSQRGENTRYIFFFFFVFLGPHPGAYGGSQARGQIGAVAASLHHSQSYARSSHVFDLNYSSWQHWILNPLSEAKD